MDQFSCRKQSGLREGSHELLLGTVAGCTQVQAKVYARFVELLHEGRCVARHERCYGRHQQVLDLEHYLDVLSRKQGPWQARAAWSSNAGLVCGHTASIRSGSR